MGAAEKELSYHVRSEESLYSEYSMRTDGLSGGKERTVDCPHYLVVLHVILFMTPPRLLGLRRSRRNDEESGAVEGGDDVLHDTTLWLLPEE